MWVNVERCHVDKYYMKELTHQNVFAVFQGSPVQLKVLNFLEEDIEGGEDDQGCQECKG